jgi:hypothetical protein
MAGFHMSDVMDSRGAWDAWCRLALDAIPADCAIDLLYRYVSMHTCRLTIESTYDL